MVILVDELVDELVDILVDILLVLFVDILMDILIDILVDILVDILEGETHISFSEVVGMAPRTGKEAGALLTPRSIQFLLIALESCHFFKLRKGSTGVYLSIFECI